MLTQNEFDLLYLLADAKEHLSQRQMAESLGWSLGKVNKLLKSFGEQSFYDRENITEKGRNALEPYRVKRAIFIAAGFGSRLAPITLNTPKPMIRVNGKRIIDTMLDAVVAAEIPEVVIVRGYMGEEFDLLHYKYPNIQFVENPLYNEYNNISSAMCVRFLFQNAYVMDADLILNNPGVIRKYEYSSNLLAFPAERTDDWCVTTDRSGFVDSVSVGGVDCYRMVGIFYWSREDGAKLAEDLQEVYQSPGGKERLWEHTPLIYKKEHYKVSIRLCNESDVTEIDTFTELKKIDRSYDI